MSESSLIKLQALRTATLLKRDSNTGILLWILWIVQKHLFCVEDVWTAGSETPVRLFKNTIFNRTFPVAASGIFRFPTCSFIKKGTPFLWDLQILRTSFYRTPPDDCFLCLSVNFEKFFRTPILWSTSGKLLISCTSCRISTCRYSKKLFHRCFSSILYKKEK